MTVSTLGEYRILKELGRGGMGVVYLAEHQRLLKRYAIKILPQAFAQDAQLVERFHNEARVMAELDHPNIVKVVNMSCKGTTYYLVMDYIESDTGAPKNLHQLMREYGGRLPEDKAEKIAMDILHALEYAHSYSSQSTPSGIIHRDIKPANILLDKHGTAKVADFGLVKILGGDPDTATKRVTLTAEGVILGTYDFMSPEQKAGKPVDHRTDIYAVGVIIYSMLTGRKPEGRFSLPSEIYPELSKKWDNVVDKCLQHLPEDRYQTAKEVIQEVKAEKILKPKKARKAQKEKKVHRGFFRELLRYGTIIIVVAIVVGAIMTYVMFKDEAFRNLLKDSVSTALKGELKQEETTQAPEKKETLKKQQTQVGLKKGGPETETKPPQPPQSPVLIPDLEQLGGTEFTDELKKLAAILEKEGITEANKEFSEYYKNASPEEKKTLDFLLSLGINIMKVYGEKPAEGFQDFAKVMQEAQKTIPAVGPLKDSWVKAMQKYKEGKQYREEGDLDKARQSYTDAQREMRRVTVLQWTKQQADTAKVKMNDSKKKVEETHLGISENLLFRTAFKAGDDADNAYDRGDYPRAKTLYSISNDVYGLITKDCQPPECIEALRDYVQKTKAETDKLGASNLSRALYSQAFRKEQQARTAFRNNAFEEAATALIESALFYENAKDRALQARRPIQTKDKKEIPPQ
jgi:serine/threonine protein kinase